MVNVAINGFGRIGRLVLRALHEQEGFDVVAVNDLTDAWTLAQLLRRDSVHGSFPAEVYAYEDKLHVGRHDIAVLGEKDPSQLPWGDLGIDVVIECTGLFRTQENLRAHLDAGAKKVLLSAPAKSEGIKTLVLGVNEHDYDGEQLVSNASCTTNCFAPLAKVLNDNYGIKGGVMTTVHSYTGDQRTIDAPHTDLRRARAAAMNIIPTSTGAAKAVMQVIPQLKGRLVASAIRVPTPDGSLVSFVADLGQRVSADQVNALFRNVAEHHLKGIIEYADEPLVSTDIIGNPHSCIVDARLTTVIEDDLLSMTAWYDNEWGYSCRMVDMLRHITSR